MATRSTEPFVMKDGKNAGRILGRSALTGQYVLRPASKAGAISLEDAAQAVKRVRSEKS